MVRALVTERAVRVTPIGTCEAAVLTCVMDQIHPAASARSSVVAET